MRRVLFSKYWSIIRTVILFLLYLCVSASANWCPGTIHAHSTFSDGTRSPADVKNKAIDSGAKFLIETDHYEQIGRHGFDNYRTSFKSSPALVVLAGAEIIARSGDHNTHTLALGTISQDSVLDQIQSKDGVQQNLINRINEMGLLAVAAHPSAISAGSYTTHPTEPTNYFYDRSKTAGLRGIEFFNEDKNAYQTTLNWYLGLLSKQDIFITSGCDEHYPVDKNDARRWGRLTYVWIDGGLSEGSLMEALANGRTIAAQDGVRLEGLNILPGFVYQKVSRPDFQFRLLFASKTKSGKKIFLYRDGLEEPVATFEIPKGSSNYQINLSDERVSPGKHTYIIEVEKLLITSPFRLDIVGNPRTDDPATAMFKGIGVRPSRYNEGTSRSEWFEKDSWPVNGSSDRFRLPATLEIFTIFRWDGRPKSPPVKLNPGKIGQKVTLPVLKDEIAVWITVSGPHGQVFKTRCGGYSAADWIYFVVSYTYTFKESGQYWIEVKDKSDRNVLGKAMFRLD